MAEAEDRAQAPDFPARQTLDAESVRAFHVEAMGDMFDLLDDDVEAIASDLFEPEERMLALFAGHPNKPRHFLACSERSVVLFKRDRDAALSMRIIPLAQIEAIDLRPLAQGRTGALVLRTVSTSAGPAFTFPLETHFAYYRVVALTRLLRRLQTGEPFDVALARLKLEAFPARELFVGDGHADEGPLLSERPESAAHSAGLPADEEEADGDALFTDEVGFESQAGTELPPQSAGMAGVLAAGSAADDAQTPQPESAVTREPESADAATQPDSAAAAPPLKGPVFQGEAPHAGTAAGAALDDDLSSALDVNVTSDPPAPSPPTAAAAAASTNEPASSRQADFAHEEQRDTTQSAPGAVPATAAPATEGADSEHEADVPPGGGLASEAGPATRTDSEEVMPSMLSSAATPFRAPVKAVSDVNLPALSDKQMRARLKMKEMAAAEERQAEVTTGSEAEAKPEAAPVGAGTPEGGEAAESPATHEVGEPDGEEVPVKPPHARKQHRQEQPHGGNDEALATAGGQAFADTGVKRNDSNGNNDNNRSEAPDSTRAPSSHAARGQSGATSEVRRSQVRGKRPPVGGSSTGGESAAVRRGQSLRRTQRSEPREKTGRAGTSATGASSPAQPLNPALKREPWFLYRGAAQHGPYPYEQLREWFRAGKLGPTEFVRSRSMSQWIRVHQVFDD